jgi:hypothetical protein
MNMRHLIPAVLLMLATTPVIAQTTPFTVTGTIVPASCTINLTNNGAVNLGQVDVAILNQAAPTDLAVQNVTVSIACAAAARVATSVTEDRPGTSYSSGDAFFGLGMTSGNNPIGYYQVAATNGLANGVGANVIASTNGTTWTTAATVPVEHGAGRRYTAVGTTGGGPATTTTAEFTLAITPTIAPASSLALTGTENINGQMTLTIVYL